MERSYKFSIVRLRPDDARGEQLNAALAVFSEDGVELLPSRRLEKVRAISAALDPDDLIRLFDNLRELDLEAVRRGASVEERIASLNVFDTIQFSSPGTFVAGRDTYGARVSAAMKALVDPEPAPFRGRIKRSKLLTQVKVALRRERVLAKPGEDLTSHRVVPQLEIDNGLVADLALKNGVMHVIETVDATNSAEPLRKAVSDIAVASLVLERARMKFSNSKTRLVYSASSSLAREAEPALEAAANQGVELVNWASAQERETFLATLADLATPFPSKRKGVRKESVTGSLWH